MQEDPSKTASANLLTEDEVKRRFVPFLKDFYKNRYQSDPASIQVEIDNVSAQGWVADGKLSFLKPDGSPFVCTYEATSRDKSDEVKFRLNTNYFIWDCLAFGAVCSAVLYLFFYNSRLPWLIQLKATGNIGLLLGVFIMGFFGWYFIMQGWRKYRYIFAIQQFRQYFADEQWVALAEDVFPAPNDPYYLELRNQCVYHGIGLAIVPFEGNVRKINDPSRLGIYGKDRKMVDWVTRAHWYQQMAENMSAMAARRPKAPDSLTVLWNRMFRPVHYLLVDPFKKYVWGTLSKPFGETSSAYNRFMSAQSVQKWVAGLALLLILPMFWKVVSYKTEEVADLEKLQHWKGGKNPEDERGYLIDGEAIPYGGEPTGVPKQYPLRAGPDPEEADDGPTITISNDEEEEDTPVTKPKEYKKSPAPKPAPARTKNACDLLQKKGWLIQESSFNSKDLAAARAATLTKAGLEAHYGAQNCLPDGKASGYLVWLGSVLPSETAARNQADKLEKMMKKAGVSKGKLFVRQIK